MMGGAVGLDAHFPQECWPFGRSNGVLGGFAKAPDCDGNRPLRKGAQALSIRLDDMSIAANAARMGSSCTNGK